jgi:hypothetical protein
MNSENAVGRKALPQGTREPIDADEFVRKGLGSFASVILIPRHSRCGTAELLCVRQQSQNILATILELRPFLGFPEINPAGKPKYLGDSEFRKLLSTTGNQTVENILYKQADW